MKGMSIKELRDKLTDESVEDVTVKGTAITETLIAKVDATDVPENLDDGGTVDFVISDDTVDSYGDIVRVGGVDLSRYVKNPVVLWVHNGHAPPIAKAVSIGVEGKELVSTAEFPGRNIYDFANTVYKLLVNKFLNAVSIGFNILEYEPIDPKQPYGGWDILKFKLSEYSVVPLPANENALAKASDVIGMRETVDFATKLLDGGNVSLTEAYMSLIGHRKTVDFGAIDRISKCGSIFCSRSSVTVDNDNNKIHNGEGSKPDDGIIESGDNEDKKMFIDTRDHDEEIEVRKTIGVDITEHEDPLVVVAKGVTISDPRDDIVIDIVDYSASKAHGVLNEDQLKEAVFTIKF